MNALTFKTFVTLALSASLAGLALQAGAAEPAANPDGNSSIKVSFHNLDFNNSSAVGDLYRRIQRSARIVCNDASAPWDASRGKYFEKCYTAAVETAVAQVNRPQLTALHRGESKPVVASK